MAWNPIWTKCPISAKYVRSHLRKAYSPIYIKGILSPLTRHTAPFTQDILAHLHKAYGPIYPRHCPFYTGHSGPFTQGNIVLFTWGILSHLHTRHVGPFRYLAPTQSIHTTCTWQTAKHSTRYITVATKLSQPQQQKVQWKENDQPAGRQSVPRHICNLVITISR